MQLLRNSAFLFLLQNLSNGSPWFGLSSFEHVLCSDLLPGDRMLTVFREEGNPKFPKHMALCASAPLRFFPTSSYRKALVGHLHSLDDTRIPNLLFYRAQVTEQHLQNTTHNDDLYMHSKID